MVLCTYYFWWFFIPSCRVSEEFQGLSTLFCYTRVSNIGCFSDLKGFHCIWGWSFSRVFVTWANPLPVGQLTVLLLPILFYFPHNFYYLHLSHHLSSFQTIGFPSNNDQLHVLRHSRVHCYATIQTSLHLRAAIPQPLCCIHFSALRVPTLPPNIVHASHLRSSIIPHAHSFLYSVLSGFRCLQNNLPATLPCNSKSRPSSHHCFQAAFESSICSLHLYSSHHLIHSRSTFKVFSLRLYLHTHNTILIFFVLFMLCFHA